MFTIFAIRAKKQILYHRPNRCIVFPLNCLRLLLQFWWLEIWSADGSGPFVGVTKNLFCYFHSKLDLLLCSISPFCSFGRKTFAVIGDRTWLSTLNTSVIPPFDLKNFHLLILLEWEQTKCSYGGRNSSLVSSSTTIMRPRVRIPSTSSTLFTNLYQFVPIDEIVSGMRKWRK